MILRDFHSDREGETGYPKSKSITIAQCVVYTSYLREEV